MTMNIYYTIYETTNLVNGKKYRGRHKTENPNDDYLGSGNNMFLAIEKYGKENFFKEVIFFAFNSKFMCEIEREFVDSEWVSRKDTYNISLGGNGLMQIDDDGNPINLMKLELTKEKLKMKYAIRMGFDDVESLRYHIFYELVEGKTLEKISKEMKTDRSTLLKYSNLNEDSDIFKRNYRLAYLGKPKSETHKENMKKPKSESHKKSMKDGYWDKRDRSQTERINSKNRDLTPKKCGFETDEEFIRVINDLIESGKTILSIAKFFKVDSNTIKKRIYDENREKYFQKSFHTKRLSRGNNLK